MDYEMSNELINMLRLLPRYRVCVCCERHQRNRPTNNHIYTDEMDSDVLSETRCDCPCRHICRLVYTTQMPQEG